MRNDDRNRFDRPAIVHVYSNESWRLTGVHIREDHSIAGALLCVDPSVESDPVRRDDTLFAPVNAPDQTFMRGRGDLTLVEIARRFNRLTNSNSGVTNEQRWGLPNVIRTEGFTSSDPLSMARHLTEHRNQRLLNTIAAHHRSLFLNARHETFRALNLDSLGGNAS